MEEFKIEIFRKENPARQFPEYKTLSPEKCDEILRKLIKVFGLENTDRLEIINELNKKYKPANFQNAEVDNFKLRELFQGLQIKPLDSVFINWYRFDRIDSFNFQDLHENFDYIWYPGPDDIEIFDESFNWMVHVSDDGDIGFLLAEGLSLS